MSFFPLEIPELDSTGKVGSARAHYPSTSSGRLRACRLAYDSGKIATSNPLLLRISFFHSSFFVGIDVRTRRSDHATVVIPRNQRIFPSAAVVLFEVAKRDFLFLPNNFNLGCTLGAIGIDFLLPLLIQVL